MAWRIQARDWDSKYVDGIASPGNAPGIVTKSSMLFVVLLLLIFATCHYWTVNTHPNSTTHNVVFFHSTMLSFPFYTQRIIRLQIPFIRTFKFGIISTSLYMFIELSRQDIGDAKFRGKKKKT